MVYSCSCPNRYNGDYAPISPNDPHLWNPRAELAGHHFFEGEDGLLYPLTLTGSFTISRLQLIRPALVLRRLQQQQQQAAEALQRKYQLILQSYDRLARLQQVLIQEQQALLAEQGRLLRQLLGD
ncbi:MAG: hypothetical protein NZM04_09585 [Methylacidiphilales bacterium]|nr:hypothetical protein [Candidatus Methylacidiphilales bacterium]